MKKILVLFLVLCIFIGGVFSTPLSTSASVELTLTVEQGLAVKITDSQIPGIWNFDETPILTTKAIQLDSSNSPVDAVLWLNILENLNVGKNVSITLKPQSFLTQGGTPIRYLVYKGEKVGTALVSNNTVQDFAEFTTTGARNLTDYKLIVELSKEDYLNAFSGDYKATISVGITTD